MPQKYAILGATGQTGGSVLKVLASEHPDEDVNCLVRSRSKLENMFPEIITPERQQQQKIKIFEGQISDIPLLTDCLRGTSAVFMCVATPYNEPHLRIARDQAEAVVAALEVLREEQQQQGQGTEKASLPLLVVLSSAETDEARFCAETPWAVRRLVFIANWWLYTDLIAAERYLVDQRKRRHPSGSREGEEGWFDVVFVKPGGITADVRRGHVLCTEGSQTFVSFLDVAGGMVQCADEGAERWGGGGGGGVSCVSVLSRGKARFGWGNGPLLIKNMLCTWIPFLYPWLF